MRSKENKLGYANIIPDEIALPLILGTSIRAIGKEWNTTIFAPENQQKSLFDLRDALSIPTLLTILGVEDLDQISQHSNLVVSAYTNPEDSRKIRYAKNILGKNHVITLDNNPEVLEYDLISKFNVTHLHSQGVVAITGNGKGKTTTALGFATKAYLEGGNVAIIQWFKEKKSGNLTWAINEHNFPTQLKNPERYNFYPTGAGFVGSPNMDRVKEKQKHQDRAKS